MREKVVTKSNKINFLHLKSIELSEKELLQKLDEHNKEIKGVSKKKKSKEKDITETKAHLKTLHESLQNFDIESQALKDQLSAQSKKRAALKVRQSNTRSGAF